MANEKEETDKIESENILIHEADEKMMNLRRRQKAWETKNCEKKKKLRTMKMDGKTMNIVRPALRFHHILLGLLSAFKKN